MFRFANPYYLLMLAPLCACAWFVYRKRIHSGLIFSGTSRVLRFHATWRAHASLFWPILTLLGLLLAVFALARPQTVFSKTRRSTDVIAIEMVADISGSMEALDMSEIDGRGMITRKRTRLDAVKETFAEFVDGRPDDLIGLITFGGYASTLCPLTTDHEALTHVLSGVSIPKPQQNRSGTIINQEELLTAIGDGLATACARLKDVQPKSRIIVLLSDGESNTGIIEPEQAVKAAKELGIKVYTIGVGSSGQAPFESRDVFGRNVIQYAEVALDEALLRKIAKDTDARYFNVRNAEGLKEALEHIDKLEKTRVERDIFHQYNELFGWFLLPGLALVLLGSGLSTLTTNRII